jgi:hypothetical protein
MYHLELRQFPHNFCRFNLTERELHEVILDAWAQDQWVEIGERKWNPHQATLMVLEGPQLPVEQLSMGRGWRNAVRQGKDITEQLLADVRATQSASHGEGTGVVPASGVTGDRSQAEGEGDPVAASEVRAALDMRLAADSLGLEALAKIGEAPVPLTDVWQLARDRYPQHSSSDCLKLAEHAIRSLVEARLVAVLTVSNGDELEPCVSSEQVERALHTIDSWSRAADSAVVLIRRA